MKKNEPKLNILFLCTGNACRSQMAEGWAKKLKSDCIEAFSAGVIKTKLNERAVRIMAEVGVDISKQYSKHVDDLCGIEFDYVITLCDNAAQSCPVFNGKTKIVHQPFADPSVLLGTDKIITDAFRKTRDAIRDFVQLLPENLQNENRNG